MKLLTILFLFTCTACATTLVRPSESDVTLDTIAASVDIEATQSEVWQIVGQAFEKNARFEPGTASSQWVAGEGALGSRRLSTGTTGNFVEVVLLKSEAPRFVSWEIVDAEIPFLVAGQASFTLQSIANNRTRVTQNVGYKMANLIMGAVAQKKFQQLFKENLVGLKHFVEKGVEIDAALATRLLKEQPNVVTISN